MYSGGGYTAAQDVKFAFQHCSSPALLVTARSRTGGDGGGGGGGSGGRVDGSNLAKRETLQCMEFAFQQCSSPALLVTARSRTGGPGKGWGWTGVTLERERHGVGVGYLIPRRAPHR